MTEGIIQKIIAKYQNSPEFMDVYPKALQRLQQELIAEIKKSFLGSSAIYTYQVRSVLIGDNQE